jgi:hypothetical protein
LSSEPDSSIGQHQMAASAYSQHTSQPSTEHNQPGLSDRTAQTPSGPAIFWSVDRSLASSKLATPAAALTAPLRPQLPQCSFPSQAAVQVHAPLVQECFITISVQNRTSANLAFSPGPHSTLPAKKKQTAGLNAALCYPQERRDPRQTKRWVAHWL